MTFSQHETKAIIGRDRPNYHRQMPKMKMHMNFASLNDHIEVVKSQREMNLMRNIEKKK